MRPGVVVPSLGRSPPTTDALARSWPDDGLAALSLGRSPSGLAALSLGRSPSGLAALSLGRSPSGLAHCSRPLPATNRSFRRLETASGTIALTSPPKRAISRTYFEAM